jgi:hypothetical protein
MNSIPALPPESGRLPNPHLGVDGAGKGEGRCLRYIMTGVQNGFDRAGVRGIRLIAPASYQRSTNSSLRYGR